MAQADVDSRRAARAVRRPAVVLKPMAGPPSSGPSSGRLKPAPAPNQRTRAEQAPSRAPGGASSAPTPMRRIIVDCRRIHLVVCAMTLGGAIACGPRTPVEASGSGAANQKPDSASGKKPDLTMEQQIAALRSEVEILKDKAVTASVAMADVSFHWSNLW